MRRRYWMCTIKTLSGESDEQTGVLSSELKCQGWIYMQEVAI